MNELQIKGSNCCRKPIRCVNCDNFIDCRDWARYVESHSSVKSYAHFDRRTSLGSGSTLAKVLNREWVAKHAFWPLIQFEKSKDRFAGKKKGSPAHLIKKSPRIIRYCSHIDRCIYQRYAFLLDRMHNKLAIDKGIDDAAIAYRTNKPRTNLHHAKRALDFIENTGECLVLVSDFKSYFDRIDHRLLKQSICNLMNINGLPADYYAVFKNVTGYSSWKWSSIMRYWKSVDPSMTRKDVNSKDVVLPQDVFRDLSKSEVMRNRKEIGVPQGCPISSVLSNIYLIDFDCDIQNFVTNLNGLYMRYCDDLFVAIPSQGAREDQRLLDSLTAKLKSYQGIAIQKDKTSAMRYERAYGGRIVELDEEFHETDRKVSLDYLGISFDGSRRSIRSKSVSKYYYRMHKKARTIARQQKGRKNIYAVYSERSKQISGKKSFIDYAKAAANVVGLDDPAADSLINHNMEKIAKAINKASSGR